MRGKHAAQRSGRHRGATANADDRHELRSTRSPPGSAGVSPACAPDARVPRVSGRPTSPFAPCGSIAGRSQSRATEMNFGLRWRRLGARSSRPPARRRRAHPGHLRGARASHPPARRRRAYPGHLHLQWEKGAGGMRGNGASGRLARPLRPVWEHCGAIAIAGDRHELRSTLAPPGSAGVSPACAAGAAWERGRLARMRAGGACTQSIRTPKPPLLPSWEKGVQGRTENMCDAHVQQHQNAMAGRFGPRPCQCSA